ncbi:MAG: hypothetical protein QXD23_02350 [Candidatus Micrarchaeaceae archaeon]
MIKNKESRNELFVDYELFDKMSKELKVHYKNIMSIRKSISKSKKASSDLKFEFLESLDLILSNVQNAFEELDKSKKIIKEL